MNDSLRALGRSLVDFAGLFPPSANPLLEAMDLYEDHRQSDENWMLGSFVLGGRWLQAFQEETSKRGSEASWPVSVVPHPDALIPQLRAAIAGASAGTWDLRAIEVPPLTLEQWSEALDLGPARADFFFEVPWGSEIGPRLDWIKASGAKAKIRSGGVVPAAYPTPQEFAAFIVACHERQLPFKATAGLHHPIRSERALTYADDAPRGTMHGFLNVLGACLALREAAADHEGLVAILSQQDPRYFGLDEQNFLVGDHRFDLSAIQSLRNDFFMGFGSCSFIEPVEDLRALGLMA